MSYLENKQISTKKNRETVDLVSHEKAMCDNIGISWEAGSIVLVAQFGARLRASKERFICTIRAPTWVRRERRCGNEERFKTARL